MLLWSTVCKQKMNFYTFKEIGMLIKYQKNMSQERQDRLNSIVKDIHIHGYSYTRKKEILKCKGSNTSNRKLEIFQCDIRKILSILDVESKRLSFGEYIYNDSKTVSQYGLVALDSLAAINGYIDLTR